MNKIIGFFMIACAVVALLPVFALSGVNADFGKPITDVQMANMFGGGWVCTGDTDCDVTIGSCNGGDTCNGSSDITYCYNCYTTAGDMCGQPSVLPGWDCANGTANCHNPWFGGCSNNSCSAINNTGITPPTDRCNPATRPDC